MQPFLIAPFTTGLDTDLSPWILPQDAFDEIINGHIRHGVLEKRQGYRLLANMTHCIAITGATNADPAVFTVADTSAMTTGDTVQLDYMLGGTWSTLDSAQYVITVLNGTTFTVALSGVDVDGTSLGSFTSGCVGYYPGNRIMGLERYVDSSNVKQLLAFDTLRASIYDSVSELFLPLDTADIFTAGNENYVNTANWASTASSTASTLFRLYFTNGVSNAGGSTDGIRVYDPSVSTTTTGQFNPTINGGNEIRGCKLIFPMRQRLVLLHTFEGGNSYPQRARWSQAQNPGGTGGSYPLSFSTEWDDSTAGRGGFVDAPTGEQIVSAEFLQDQLIVFFTESVWTLRATPDPALPFRWDRINSFRACDAPQGTSSFDRYITAFGLRGITATDGVETKRWDQRIEDFVHDEVNGNEFGKVYSKRSFTTRRFWTLYPSTESTDADHALIYDDESGAFSKYQIDMNVLGYGGVSKDYELSDFPSAADDSGLPVTLSDASDQTLNSYVWDESSEIFIGGDRAGAVFILETDGDDQTAEISFEIESAAWNPWIKEGAQAQMGYMDVFVDTVQTAEVLYEFYKNNDETPYTTHSSDLLPNLIEKAEIGSITQASPGVVVANSHGLSDGQEIYIYKVKGMVEVNGGPYTVTVVDDNSFSIGEDSSAFTAYTTGGVITELPFERGKTWKRIYAGGTGYQHKVKITSIGVDEPLRIHAFMPWFRKTGRRTI